MTTALSIITSTLRELGVAESGQALDAEEVNVCFLALNVLADSWLTSTYAYTSSTVSAALSDAPSMTIGTGMQINTPRPVRLEDGCFIRVGGIDSPLRVINQAEYNAIPVKTQVGSWPAVCYYDAGSPTGNVYFFPQGACTVFLNVQLQLSQFADLNTSYTLPPGYARAFELSLTEEVATKFGRQVSPMTMRNAKEARRTVKRTNFRVPQLVPDRRTNIDVLGGIGHDGTVDGGTP